MLEKLLERCGDNRDIPTVMALDAMMAGVDTTGASVTFFRPTAQQRHRLDHWAIDYCNHVLGRRHSIDQPAVVMADY